MSTFTTIKSTKNYSMFAYDKDNRPLNIKRHKLLIAAMKEYNFLKCFPMVVFRNKNGDLVIKDGQHRLAIAESLELPVYYVESEIDFDISKVNPTGKNWVFTDYVDRYVVLGYEDYKDALEFAEKYAVPITAAFSMLAGTVSFNNISQEAITGKFKIKDWAYANAVVSIYKPLLDINPKLNKRNLCDACMAIARVKNFGKKRLLKNATLCPEKLKNFSTREGCLDMLEAIYNYNSRQLFSLRNEALMVLRKRSAVQRNKADAA